MCWIAWRPLGSLNGGTPDTGNLTLAIALIVCALINIAFTVFQAYSSSKVMESIRGMLPQASNVVRNGKTLQIIASELVPGDVILIEVGT